MTNKAPKIALVYDRVNKFGGAERVLQTLHRIYPHAPLYTSVYEPKTATWAEGWVIRPSYLNHFSFLRSRHELLAPLMPYAFESFDLSAFDLVISVTSAEAKGVITRPPTHHLCYLLTPTRYLWHQTHLHAGSGVTKAFRLPWLSGLRQWDYVAAQRPDTTVAISRTSAQRTQKYYGRPVDAIIYPPVDTTVFMAHPSTCATPRRDYYLIVSRLVAYKTLTYVIDAFVSRPQDELVIIGTGSDRDRLRSLSRSAPNIHFIDAVTNSELICYYHHARALIFPQEEDFGLVAVEAQAVGTPVIAYAQGGAAETIVPQQTGFLYNEQSVACLGQALDSWSAYTYSKPIIKHHAQKYDTKVFTQAFTKLVKEILCQRTTSK